MYNIKDGMGSISTKDEMYKLWQYCKQKKDNSQRHHDSTSCRDCQRLSQGYIEAMDDVIKFIEQEVGGGWA